MLNLAFFYYFFWIATLLTVARNDDCGIFCIIQQNTKCPQKTI
ncbi:hypothetical protein [Rickettsia hoogstraalii]|nr:hypothetical protein [Rickettsia hoogstraalii]